MNNCDSFWFWFMRPFAETLGGIALLLLIGATFVGIYILALVIDKIFYKKNEKNKEV